MKKSKDFKEAPRIDIFFTSEKGWIPMWLATFVLRRVRKVRFYRKDGTYKAYVFKEGFVRKHEE